MDKRTRVFAAMDKKMVDHVPVGFWYHFPSDQSVGQASVDAHVAYYKDCDTDLLKIMSDGYFPYPVPDSIAAVKDWYTLKPLDEHHPWIEEQVERARGIVDAVGKECPVFYNVFAPFSSIRFGAGEERVMQDLKEDQEAILYALDIIAQSAMVLIRRLLLEAGCDGIYYCVQGGELDRFTYEEYRNLITPSDVRVLAYANSLKDYNILHCCGWAGDKNRLEIWKDYPVKTVNWAVYVEELSLEQGREFYKGKACLGGFESLHQPNGEANTGVLHRGTKEEVQAFTKKLICDFGKTGLLLGADCTIFSDIDHERIRWVVEQARAL